MESEDTNKKSAHEVSRENNGWTPLPWKAWGSWFSWSSPVGLGLGWTLFILPLGIFIILLKQAGIL